jgi:hypothetical protein
MFWKSFSILLFLGYACFWFYTHWDAKPLILVTKCLPVFTVSIIITWVYSNCFKKVLLRYHCILNCTIWLYTRIYRYL